MEKLDNIIYEKLNLDVYKERINNLLKDKTLIDLGIEKHIIGKTRYNYDIDLIEVGKGNHDIFIVGGTHSSEIITVDFVCQLINNIKNINEFDPNYYKINFIPILNPEGFDIVTNVIDNIKPYEYEIKSKEYYLRYRNDSIIYNIFYDLNNIINSSSFFTDFKKFINENRNWSMLKDNRSMPNICIFNNIINNINNDSNKLILINACKKTKELIDKDSNINDYFLYEFMNKLEVFFNKMIIRDLTKEEKFHQKMFKNIDISNLNIKNNDLIKSLDSVYKNLPKGSIVSHDPNGIYVNLNENSPFNPGVDNTSIEWMYGSKSNLQFFVKGPVGLACEKENNFEYTIENKILYNLINNSYKKGKYLATFLYHGTGGLIYYIPSENNNFLNYNEQLYNAYNKGIYSYSNYEYTGINEFEGIGYDDLLRNKFPGVLLIELSKMGGNPISPYGDKNNIYNTINENINGFNEVLKYLKSINISDELKTNINL